MSLSSFTKFDTNGKINVYDGSGTVVSILGVPYVEGDVKVTGLGSRLNALVVTEARGRVTGYGWGDRVFPMITLSEQITQLVATSAPGPLRDFLTKTGAYASNTSVLGSGSGLPYAVKIELVTQGTAFGDADDTLTLNKVLFPQYDYEWGRPNKHKWAGKVCGTVLLNGTTIGQEIDTAGV